MASTLAEKLIMLRGKKTQQKVANDVGISKSTLGMYETGQRIPRDEIKMKLADYYHVNVGELFYNQNCHDSW